MANLTEILERVRADILLREKIEGLNLKQKAAIYLCANPDGLFEFTRKASGPVPALEVVVNRSEQGYHVIVNSVPYDQKYHRSTSSPIREEGVVDKIRIYLSEVIPQTHK